jgi:sugar diacid utilization regulator
LFTFKNKRKRKRGEMKISYQNAAKESVVSVCRFPPSQCHFTESHKLKVPSVNERKTHMQGTEKAFLAQSMLLK